MRLLLLRLAISIHAPRTGSDILLFSSKAAFFYFNPRSPHGERRIHTSAHLQANSKFQSTLPARGATTKHMAHRRKFPYFNPRSPHGERPIVRVGDAISNAISIHAPRTGSDAIDAVYCHVGNISIHAPRTGSDTSPISSGKSTTYFNPRSPHGERPAPASPGKPNRYFNPRSPHGERRAGSGGASGTEAISIHAPRTGSDGN